MGYKHLHDVIRYNKSSYATFRPFIHKYTVLHTAYYVQWAATKMVPSIKYLSYKERLSGLHLPVLGKRRERGDLIVIYKTWEHEEVNWNDLIYDAQGTRGCGRMLKKSANRRVARVSEIDVL